MTFGEELMEQANEKLREQISAAASSCDGHVTNGSLEAIMKIVQKELDSQYELGYNDGLNQVHGIGD